ncbi:MAG: multicopper oxidase domain-containing protein [Pseudomonadota bacterium]
MLIRPTRRRFLASAAALPLAGLARPVRAEVAEMSIGTRQIEVLGRSATVFGINGYDGQLGFYGRAGDRFQLGIQNDADQGIITHWHGQVMAAEGQDRAYTGGGTLAPGAVDWMDFELTPGTHWMHSHQLSEQLLMAAPMICREADAEDIQEHVIMLHDFSFQTPEEILAALGGSDMHAQGASGGMDMAGMDHSGGDMAGMQMPGMAMGGGMRVHANDVAYDAYLANDRTLADPEVVQVDAGARLRLRIINGGTATAFWIDPGMLETVAIAVDGNACAPLAAKMYPMAQGQRLDLVVTIPPEGGTFPIFAQVEAARMRTGIVLATSDAKIARLSDLAEVEAAHVNTSFDAGLRAVDTLPERSGQMAHLILGEEAGYRFTINGKVHGEDTPIAAKVGERLELMFMNTGMMMHPMHLHGHHFQVVDVGMGRFNGPRRDVVVVPPGGMVTVAVDLDKPGSWYLHCHHLYHMATGMMTEVLVS